MAGLLTVVAGLLTAVAPLLTAVAGLLTSGGVEAVARQTNSQLLKQRFNTALRQLLTVLTPRAAVPTAGPIPGIPF